MAVNNPISGLNKTFDNRIRLGVMSILMVNTEVSFNDLKQMLEVTDGNLATHLQTLEETAPLTHAATVFDHAWEPSLQPVVKTGHLFRRCIL